MVCRKFSIKEKPISLHPMIAVGDDRGTENNSLITIHRIITLLKIGFKDTYLALIFHLGRKEEVLLDTEQILKQI